MNFCSHFGKYLIGLVCFYDTYYVQVSVNDISYKVYN